MSSVLPPNKDDCSFTISPTCPDVGAEIATAIAQVKHISPLDLSPLYRSVDCDALTNLFRHGVEQEAEWSIEFDHEGVRVTLTGDGIGRAMRVGTDA